MKGRSLMRKRGFTLVELLVVIAIIALLLAVLTSALSEARMSAKKLVCESNLHQLGIAVIAYANDYNQRLPRQDIADSTGMNTWDVSHALIGYDDKGNFGFYRAPTGGFQPCVLYSYGIKKEESVYCPFLPAREKARARLCAGPDYIKYTLWVSYSWWVPRKSGGVLFPYDNPTSTPDTVSWPEKTTSKGISTHPITTDCIMRKSYLKDDLSDNPSAVTDTVIAEYNYLKWEKEVYGLHARNGRIRDINLLYGDGRVEGRINNGKNIRTRFQQPKYLCKNMY
jgi:prepilin-type N-terminal cleavage/methylation domain-containing protein